MATIKLNEIDLNCHTKTLSVQTLLCCLVCFLPSSCELLHVFRILLFPTFKLQRFCRATLIAHHRLARLEKNGATVNTAFFAATELRTSVEFEWSEEDTKYDNIAVTMHNDTRFPVAKKAAYS
ncbi:uncharacterized protein EV154DRAFT_488555 [Mucor mucedo]|uniref:uncharacterized protein n=1 Tax=Mucor mucedo TaxID=29922 RepID=UPI00221FD04C|nr:uncharacterized protein EV154DRAFT_488555 [Mucor mucedo]KAI7866383.1 hypothetical protein EV154DRAFT_488555 [Mucor mucedo]